MGQALAEELIRDCADNLRGKSLGIVSRTGDSQAVLDRTEGFREALKGCGTRISWNVEGIFGEGEETLETLPKVDFVLLWMTEAQPRRESMLRQMIFTEPLFMGSEIPQRLSTIWIQEESSAW